MARRDRGSRKKSIGKPGAHRPRGPEHAIPFNVPGYDPEDRIIRSENIQRLRGAEKFVRRLREELAAVEEVRVEDLYDPRVPLDRRAVVTQAIKFSQKLLRLRGGPALTPDQLARMEIEVQRFLDDALAGRNFDAALILQNNAAVSPVVGTLGGVFFATERGVPVMFADITGGDIAKAAGMLFDIIIEVMGLLFSVIGVSLDLPAGARKKIGDLLTRLLGEERCQRVLTRLLKALKAKDWKKAAEIVEENDLMAIFQEIIGHALLQLPWYELALAFAKLAAWIIALASGAGAVAFAAKLAGLAMDVVEMGLKIAHLLDGGEEH